MHTKKLTNLGYIILTIVFACGQHPVAAQRKAEIDTLIILFDRIEKNDLIAADSVARLAYKLSTESGYKNGEAGALSNMARVNIRQGNSKKAVELLFRVLKIYEQEKELQNERRHTSAIVRLAGALYFAGDYKRSLIYSQKAITAARENNFDDLLALGCRVRGEVQRDKGQLDSSLHYFTAAARIFASQNNLVHLANIYVDIGVNYYYKGDYQQAIAYNKKFYELAKKLKIETDYATGLHNIGEFFFLLKSYTNALSYLDSAQLYGERFNQFTTLQDTYKVKAQVYTALQNADSAAAYYQKVIAVKDSISTDIYKKELATVQTNLDVYRHEAENKILVKEKSIATLYRNLAIIGFIAIVSILALVLLRQRLRVQNAVKKKLEQEVRERTSEILEQKATIEDVNLKLQLSLNRAKVDPHFVFNVLNSIQHLVLEKNATEASDHLAKLSRLARYILEKSSLDEVSLREETTMLNQYLQLEQLRLDNKFSYKINSSVSDETRLPAMLIQPYVENAILHGFGSLNSTDLALNINIHANSATLTIEIEDNGKGRAEQVRGDGHQSIGSTLGKERLNILSKLDHGYYNIIITDLNPGTPERKGTRVTLELPLKTKTVAA